LDCAQTRGLLKALVSEQPGLVDAIDRQVNLLSSPERTRKPAQTPRVTAIDPTPFRWQVKQIIRESVSLVEQGWDDDLPYVEELRSLIEQAEVIWQRGWGIPNLR
jgi:hypothetical protein